MKPVPATETPPAAGVVLATGRRLNEILRALEARTQRNPAEAGAKGVQGVAVQGGPQVCRMDGRARFDETKVYFISRAFFGRLQAALAARRPLSVGGVSADGFRAGSGASTRSVPELDATPQGLAALTDQLRRMTPRQCREAGPRGYRLEADRPQAAPKPNGLVLELERWRAEAYFCYIHVDEDGLMFKTSRVKKNYEHGTIEETQTAGGGPMFWLPGESHAGCPNIVVEDDRNPGFDYGELEDEDDPEYETSFTLAMLRTAAEGAVERDPGDTAVGSAGITTLTDLSGTWLELDDDDGQTGVRIWFNRNGTQPPPPAPPGGRLLEVAYLSSDTLLEVGTKLRAAISGDGAWIVSGGTITWTQPGARRGHPGTAPANVTMSNSGGSGADFSVWTWLGKEALPTFPSAIGLARWVTSGVSDALVRRPRFRWRNIGRDTLQVSWSESEGGGGSITLAPSARSGWYTSQVPTDAGEQGQITDLHVTVD